MRLLDGNSSMKKISHMLLGNMLLFFSLWAGAASAASGAIPVPQSRETFLYSASASPFEAKSPSEAKPVGIGSLAEGGDTFSLQVTIGPFARPVDMYLTLLSPDEKSAPVLTLAPDNTFKPFLIGSRPWRGKVTSADEAVMNIPASSLASGPYVLMFAVMPADVQDRYYLWTVPFLVP